MIERQGRRLRGPHAPHAQRRPRRTPASRSGSLDRPGTATGSAYTRTGRCCWRRRRGGRYSADGAAVEVAGRSLSVQRCLRLNDRCRDAACCSGCRWTRPSDNRTSPSRRRDELVLTRRRAAVAVAEVAVIASLAAAREGEAVATPERDLGLEVASQPSHEVRLPSSHVSSLSITVSPQRAGRQSVRQASGAASSLAAPSSQISQNGTRTPSPHDAVPGVQSVTDAAVRVLLSVERHRRG